MDRMNDIAQLALALAMGLALGAIFFGGLWLSIRRGMSSPRPWLWFAGSLLIRLAIVAAGFYFVAGGGWEAMLSCLLGFLLVRQAAIRLARTKLKKEVNYENQP